jgi:predicted nucleotidyltransferase
VESSESVDVEVYKYSVNTWLPVLKSVYKALSSEYTTVIVGSQVLYLTLGEPVETKNIDLLIEDYNPVRVADLISRALNLEELRYEVFKARDGNLMTHVFVPLTIGVLAVEVMSRLHLGRISFSPLADEILHVNIDDFNCITLTPEAYALLQATRPGGFRVVDVERFRRVRDRVNWGRVVELARAYNAIGLVLDFIRAVGVAIG